MSIDRTFIAIIYDGNTIRTERLLLTDDGRPIFEQVSEALEPDDPEDYVPDVNAIVEIPNAYEGYIYAPE